MKSAKKLRFVSALLAAVFIIGSGFAVRTDAKEVRSAVPQVRLDGRAYTGKVSLDDGVTYVGLREFSEKLGADVSWDARDGRATVKTGTLELTYKVGETGFVSGGRYLYFTGSSYVSGGRIYVPLRALGTAFGYEVYWDAVGFCANLTSQGSSGGAGYSQDDLYWLSRIISAEAEGESFTGKLAVGSVVLNRVRSSEFPNTIDGVIFDRKNGVQFTPVANGNIYKTPDADSVRAARLCLEGNIVRDDILFFMNSAIAESFWISSNCRYVMTIGKHDFYA